MCPTMFTDLMPLFPLVIPFLLVLFRLLGLFAFVPFFSNSAIPGKLKVLLGLAISFCVWNVAPHVKEYGAVVPETLPAWCWRWRGIEHRTADRADAGRRFLAGFSSGRTW